MTLAAWPEDGLLMGKLAGQIGAIDTERTLLHKRKQNFRFVVLLRFRSKVTD